MMTLMESSMILMDKGASFNKYAAQTLAVMDESGLPYLLNPMGTVVESERDQVVDLLARCFRTLDKNPEGIKSAPKIWFPQGSTRCTFE